MSEQANKLLASMLDDREEIPWDEAVEAVEDHCGVKTNTAETYIRRADKATYEKTLEGDKVIIDPADKSDTVLKDTETEVIEEPVGDRTSSKFGELAVLEDKGFLLDAEGHEDGYFRRRMSSDKDSPLFKKTDVQVVTSTMSIDDASTMLIGKHGVGKDKLLLHICAKTNRPAIRLVASDDADFIDLLIGTYRPNEDGDFEFTKGLLVIALENGYTFILDEFNNLSGKLQTMLNKILEGSNQNKLAIPETNEIIEPHPEFNFVGTMNPNEVGYAQRESLDAATYSRFIPVEIPPLDTETEKKVIAGETHWEEDEETLDLLLREDGGVVSGIRALHNQGRTELWASTRDVMQIAWMEEKIGDAQAAAELVLAGRADPEDESEIRSSIRDNHWP